MEVLETGIDDLVEYLKEKRERDIGEISEKLGYPKDVIEEWAKVLEEHDILEIDYGLTSTKLKMKEHEEEKKERVKEKLKNDKKEKFVCDDCGRTFDTERGLLTHRGIIHKGDEDS